MARFDPDHYPDRLAFERHARRIRAQELDRLLGAAWARLGARWDELLHGIARPVVSASARARRHAHH